MYLFKEIEMPLVEVLADMEMTGIKVNSEYLKNFGEKLQQEFTNLEQEIYTLAGEEFNISSPKQLGVILFEKLSLPYPKRVKDGNFSTAKEILDKLSGRYEIVDKVLRYRTLTKIYTTYVIGLLSEVQDCRIHTIFNQTLTRTGRLSSVSPNLQNIPIRLEEGRMIRKAFVPDEDSYLLSSDYSQVELRVLAHIAKDETMIEAFKSGADIHTISASQVFKVPIEEVSKQLRSKAKAVNFGIVYGISEFGLAEQIDINRKEAKSYIEQYLETYHGIRDYMKDIVEETKQKGYVSTLFGRRRYINELKSKNYMVRRFGDRAAMNTPIQGTAADIMKVAMIKVYNELNKRNLKSKIVLQIHDELLIETLLEEKEEVKTILKESMENAAELLVPLQVDIEEGKSWYQAK